ncbi:DUF4925 domain-containing protein [Bacteroides sp. GM023]|uniref:DUF4925 domain-containing protein n=1 Tax=Bacteroides sp. GM023 TaxID=2723058 RepID=UPI00168BE028|nr:DUF4925 domain-containing protein [Bacteroides sp. GM023]MBD3588433.1 DUF4925 domain-containing protein [Bacteroides sp. GM023]
MKNKLFYLISAACLLSYTGTFTSCVNGVDDEYLEQKITDDTKAEDEIPDLNGEYSMVGDFDLEMICNGDLLEGQKVVMAVDENNESATITFTAIETDLESVIALIPGANLIQGMGLKYTGSCPIPGVKELTFTNVSVYKRGSTYAFRGSLDQKTYTMEYEGKITDGKMTLNINYELTETKLASTWNLQKPNLELPSPMMTPLWFDWDTNLKIKFGEINIPGLGDMNIDTYTPNELQGLLYFAAMFQVFNLQQTVADLLQSITAMPNGSLYATYAWDSDTSNPDRWSSNMNRNIIRYYYDEKNENRIYIEINGQFLLNTIKSLVQPTPNTRGAAEDLKALGTKLIEFLKPALENGIPCEYSINNNKLSINIDGEFLLGALKLLAEVGNNEAAMGFLMPLLKSDPTMAQYAPNLEIFLKRLPDLLTYKEESGSGELSGECKYVKIGLHLER